jgi:hypothetical protein
MLTIPLQLLPRLIKRGSIQPLHYQLFKHNDKFNFTRHEDVLSSGGRAPLFFTSAIDLAKWLTSRPGSHLIGPWFDPRAGQNGLFPAGKRIPAFRPLTIPFTDWAIEAPPSLSVSK